MDKNRGIWLAIAGILIVGILVTLSTNKFVTNQEQTMAAVALETSKAAAAQKERGTETKAGEGTTVAETPAEEPEPQAVAAGLTDLENQSPAGSQSDMQSAAPAQILSESGSEISPVAEITAESSAEETVQSPLKSSNKIQENLQAEAQGDLGTYYKKRLEELDSQIKKMKESDTAQTTYSMTTNAEKEWKLWDAELNTVYNEILGLLDEEESKQLVEEERQWIKMRDAAALESSQKYSGGTMEGLEYTSTLVSCTRDRVYDLVNTYLCE